MSTEKTAVPQGIMETGMTALNKIIHKFGVYFVILILVLIGTILFQGKFFSAKNFLNVIDSLTILGIAAVGIAFVTYSGNYVDMSIPTSPAIIRVVVSLYPYSPKSLRAALRILAFIELGSLRAFSRREGIHRPPFN